MTAKTREQINKERRGKWGALTPEERRASLDIRNIQLREKYKDKGDKIKSSHRKYYANNTEKCKLTRHNWYIQNTDKVVELNSSWKERHPEYKIKRNKTHKRYLLFTNYGITWEEYNKILLDQDNKCKICGKFFCFDGGKGKVPFIDHNHTTGKVRGLLCCNCNLGIGNLKDSTEILEKAIQYLKDNS